MKDAQTRSVVSEVLELVARLDVQVETRDRWDKTVLDRMRDAEVGHPRSPSLDPSSGGGGVEDMADELRGRLGYNDPTGQAGVQVATKGDRAARDRSETDKAWLRILRDLRMIEDAYGRHNPRTANAIEREATGRTMDEPGCESCSRLPGAHGQPRWEPVAVEKAKVGNDTKRLCRWCNDHLKATGDIPTRAQVDAHHSGKRVSRSVA